MSKRALIVEDDSNIAELLRLYLGKDGFDVMLAADGGKAESSFDLFQPDIVLLDVMLPVKNGWQICQDIRRKSSVPIIMLTAKGETKDKINGLDMGADDYVTKPFNPLEVVARVRSQIRRYMQLGGTAIKPSEITIGGISLDDKSKEVTLDGEKINLTPTEYDILKLLMENPGQVFSPKEIYTNVWKSEPYGAEGVVAVHIRHIREKTEINPAEPRYICSVWGQGYKIDQGRNKK